MGSSEYKLCYQAPFFECELSPAKVGEDINLYSCYAPFPLGRAITKWKLSYSKPALGYRTDRMRRLKLHKFKSDYNWSLK